MPSKLAADIAPEALARAQLVDHLRGLEPSADDGIDRAAVPADSTAPIAEAGRTCLPVLLANARAAEPGETESAEALMQDIADKHGIATRDVKQIIHRKGVLI